MKNLLIIMLFFNNTFSYSPNLTIEGGVDINFSSNKLINSYLNISGEIFFNKMLMHEDFFSVYVGPVFEINYFKKVQGILGINCILLNNCEFIKDICSVRILIGIKYLPIKHLNIVKFFFTFKNDKKWIFEIKLDFSKTVYKKHHRFIRFGTIYNYNPNNDLKRENKFIQNSSNCIPKESESTDKDGQFPVDVVNLENVNKLNYNNVPNCKKNSFNIFSSFKRKLLSFKKGRENSENDKDQVSPTNLSDIKFMNASNSDKNLNSNGTVSKVSKILKKFTGWWKKNDYNDNESISNDLQSCHSESDKDEYDDIDHIIF